MSEEPDEYVDLYPFKKPRSAHQAYQPAEIRLKPNASSTATKP